jgi:hypothetical protein
MAAEILRALGDHDPLDESRGMIRALGGWIHDVPY